MNLLNPTLILKSLSKHKHDIKLHCFKSIPSTQTYLKQLPDTQAIDIAICEQQTAGIGRFGRVWHSPYGENIYCSIKIPLTCDMQALSGLSLVMGLAIIKTLESHTSTALHLKWPNDILANHKKLAGILIDLQRTNPKNTTIIIGMGINVNGKSYKHIEKANTSLFELTKTQSDRNILIPALIANCIEALNTFQNQGFDYFFQQWDKYDALKDKVITVKLAKTTLTGQSQGITQQGELKLKTNDGNVHVLSMGEITLAGAQESMNLGERSDLSAGG